jgi:hypothetical protein
MAPYNPEHNGVAKQMNRMIHKRIVSMLHHSELTDGFWAEALLTIDLLDSRYYKSFGLKKARLRKPVDLWMRGVRAYAKGQTS